LKLEQHARDARIGLWVDNNPTPPWEYRNQQRSGNTTTADILNTVQGESGIYHGNVKSHVFHSSTCRDFNCKNCTVVFGSIQEAFGAGYHGHKDCIRNQPDH
jgi:micrococcal nuclease